MLSEAARDLYYGLPDPVRRAHLVRRRAPLWLSAGILFVHVPRAAGASINQAVYGRFMGHVRASDVDRWGTIAVKALPRFAVVRNPWNRLVSAYRFVRRGRGSGSNAAQVRWRERYYGPEFETFDRFVTEWLSRRDVERLDYVFQPQHRFVCDKAGKALVDHLGRFENLAPTLDFVGTHLGHALELGRDNSSGEAMDYRSFYTRELAQRVGQIYERDVELFGYRF